MTACLAKSERHKSAALRRSHSRVFNSLIALNSCAPGGRKNAPIKKKELLLASSSWVSQQVQRNKKTIKNNRTTTIVKSGIICNQIK
jgi:hypothetical protein